MSVLKKLLSGGGNSISKIHPTSNSEYSQDSEHTQDNLLPLRKSFNHEDAFTINQKEHPPIKTKKVVPIGAKRKYVY